MPKDLGTEEKKVWRELVKRIPADVFRKIDGLAQFPILCECIVLRRKLGERLRDDPTDARTHRLYMQTVAHISKLSIQYGLAPTDRARMKFEQEVIDDAEEWMASE